MHVIYADGVGRHKLEEFLLCDETGRTVDLTNAISSWVIATAGYRHRAEWQCFSRMGHLTNHSRVKWKVIKKYFFLGFLQGQNRKKRSDQEQIKENQGLTKQVKAYIFNCGINTVMMHMCTWLLVVWMWAARESWAGLLRRGLYLVAERQEVGSIFHLSLRWAKWHLCSHNIEHISAGKLSSE